MHEKKQTFTLIFILIPDSSILLLLCFHRMNIYTSNYFGYVLFSVSKYGYALYVENICLLDMWVMCFWKSLRKWVESEISYTHTASREFQGERKIHIFSLLPLFIHSSNFICISQVFIDEIKFDALFRKIFF